MRVFIVSLMALVVVHVTAYHFGLDNYFPDLSYPLSGLWISGVGGGYSYGSGFGGFNFPSSNGYVPKRVQIPVPIFLEGEHGFGNGGLIVTLIIFLVLYGMLKTNWLSGISDNLFTSG